MPKKSYDDVLDPTKMSREEKIGRTKQKLGEADIRSLKAQIAEHEGHIAEANNLTNPPDLTEVKRNLQHLKDIVNHDEDLVPKSGTEKDRLAKRASDIEDILKKEMPTKREMWPKAGSVEAQQAVRHNLKFQEQRDGLCKEWQEIQKKLNPEDPYAQSLELIRPD